MGYSDLRPVCVNALGSIYGGARGTVRGAPRKRSKMSFFFTGDDEDSRPTTPESGVSYVPLTPDGELLNILQKGGPDALRNALVVEMTQGKRTLDEHNTKFKQIIADKKEHHDFTQKANAIANNNAPPRGLVPKNPKSGTPRVLGF